MSELSQVALEFSHLCLGWKVRDACLTTQQKIVNYAKAKPPQQEMDYLFDYKDLNAVMEAVRKWCDTNECNLYMEGGRRTELWFVNITHDAQWIVDARHKDLCQALMAACVEASRKLHSGE